MKKNKLQILSHSVSPIINKTHSMSECAKVHTNVYFKTGGGADGGEEGQNSQQMARKSEQDTQWQNKRVRNSWWVHGQEIQGTNGHQNKQKSGQSQCHAATWLLEFITHRLHLMGLQNGTWTVTSFSSCHLPKCRFQSNFSSVLRCLQPSV